MVTIVRTSRVALAAGVALSLVLTGVRAQSGPSARADENVPVEISSVVISAFQQVEVPARERGPLVAVDVEEGDLVEASQRLATLDESDAVLAAKRARIQFEAAQTEAENTIRIRLAQKSFELAKSELARGQKARAKFENAISDEEIQERQLAVDKAELEVAQAEHEQRRARDGARLAETELLIAERNLSRCRIEAPFAGVVEQVRQRSGEWLEPGQAVFRIVRLDSLRAEGFLTLKEAQMLAPGQKVILGVELPQVGRRQFEGVLKFISPEVNPVDGRVRVWALIANPERALRPGMRASLAIVPAKDAARNTAAQE